MSSFQEMGFLSDDHAAAFPLECRKKYAEWFQHIHAINRIAQKAQYEIQVNSSDQQQIIVVGLFARTLSNFQGAILLAERGMTDQSKILVRSLVEVLFQLGAATSNQKYVENYIFKDVLHRRKYALAVLKRNPNDQSAKELSEQAEKEIQEYGIKEGEVKQQTSAYSAAKVGGMSEFYDSTYTLFSEATHTSVGEVQRSHLIHRNGEVVELKNEPSYLDIELVFTVTCQSMAEAVSRVAGFFKMDLDTGLEKSVKAINSLFQDKRG